MENWRKYNQLLMDFTKHNEREGVAKPRNGRAGFLFFVLRLFAWSTIWLWLNPQLINRRPWMDEPTSTLEQLVLYLISFALLEITFRRIVWGGMKRPTRKAFPAVIRPECPEHPWISLTDCIPQVGAIFEVFCADGGTRNGRMVEREDGATGMVIEFQPKEQELLEENPWRFRPTHWRLNRNQVAAGKEVR